MKAVLPGVLAAVALPLVARVLHGALSRPVGDVVHEVVIAVGLGIAIAATGFPRRMRPGLEVASGRILRVGIVLLGARISLQEIVELGGPALALVAVLMAVAFTVALSVGRAAAIGRRLGTLLGVGVAICGNSAIVASAPTIGAHDDEIAQAVAVNTFFGTLALFLYPFIGELLSLGAASYGMWAGTAINDTSQVVAAGFAHSDAAGQVAVTVKLVRNALMAPVLLGLAIAFRGAGAEMTVSRIRKAVPGFVVAFLLLAVATSLGAVDALSEAIGVALGDAALAASRLLILVGLAAVGLSTPPSAFRRGGARVLLVGFSTAAVVSIVSLTLISIFDPLG